VDHVRSIGAHTTSPATRSIGDESLPRKADHIYAETNGTYRYMGAQACLNTPSVTREDDLLEVNPCQFALNLDLSLPLPTVDGRTHLHLMQAYTTAVDTFYPLLTDREHSLGSDLATSSAADRFTLFMVYSIACRLTPNSAERWHILGHCCYKEAMSLLDSCTAEADSITLKSVLLLAIHALLLPKSGNLGQQIALASRLAIEIGTQDLSPTETANLENMHSTIFCLENAMSSTLDRPATFHEPAWELIYDHSTPSKYLCSLYRVQHRFRRRKAATHTIKLPKEPPLDSHLLIVLRQTELMLNPTAQNAITLLSALSSHNSLETFLLPHWVYRTAILILESRTTLDPSQVLQSYGEACELLSRYARRWPEVTVLYRKIKHHLKS
jgi:hypothetical protein